VGPDKFDAGNVTNQLKHSLSCL